MAVIDKVPGIEVTVQVDGQAATEYIDPYASDSDPDDDLECPVVSRYIESIDDTEFSIKIAVDNDLYAWKDVKHSLIAKTKVDGRWIDGPIIDKSTKMRVVEGTDEYSEASKQWYQRTLKFSAVNTVDDDNTKRTRKAIKAVKRVGLIEVSLERCTLVKRVSTAPTPFTNTNTLEVSEKALKKNFISHSTSFGIKKAVTKPRVWSTRSISEDNGPIAVFRFIYRSKENLKKELVIPRSPSPEPKPAAPPVSRSVHNMTISELQRLAQERLDQIKDEGVNSPIKRENKEVAGIGEDRLTKKRGVAEVVDVDEEAAKARSKKRLAVTIDLTDD
ncbi:hypothetical protein F5Y07DRAFT_395043 [Xylaria sp. FL0933]|nr:hypothetical protein F5Y07DRAFT_395043 [Xylaria sp. FL0933]